MTSKNAEWCDVLSAAKRAGLGDEFLRELRWSKLAPSELHDFRESLTKLRGTLKRAEKAWPGVLTDFGISTWPAKLKQLERQIRHLTFPHIPTEQRHIASAGDKGSIRTGHAIYSAFLAMPDEDSAYADACRLLMAHAFLAHFIVLCIPAEKKLSKSLVKGDTSLEAYEAYTGIKPWPALTISPYHIGLALRGLFSGDEWARAMMMLFPVTDALVTFAGCPDFDIASAASVSDKSPKWLEEKRDCVRRYLAQAWGIKLRQKGHGRPVDADPQDPAYRFDECPNEDEEEGEGDGDGQDDHQNGPGGSGQNRRGKKRKGRRGRAAPRRHGSSAGAGTDQAILAGKFLANAKERLSPSELVVLDVTSRREFECIMAGLKNHNRDDKGPVDSLRPSEDPHIEHAECILFTLVMLWTASGIERAKNLQLVGSTEFNGANPLTIFMDPNGNGQDAIIRIHTGWPEDAPRRAPMSLDRNRTENVRLRDPAGLGPMIWDFVTTVNRLSLQSGPQYVFRRPLEFYGQRVTDLLTRLDPTGRLTPARVQSFLYDELMSWSGRDASATTIITGNYRDTARVQMFYAVRRERRMQEIQAGTVNHARSRINLASMPRIGGDQARLQLSLLTEGTRRIEPALRFEPAPDDEVYIAINACPIDVEMQRAVQALIDKLCGPWQLSDPDQWNEYFNLYTFYTVWFFGFVVGSRAIECPYLWLHEIDPVGLTARYEEKGPRKARLVWLLPELFKQMQNYEAFLRSTRLGKLTDQPCWLVDKDGKPTVVQPSTYEEYVHRFLPGYPTNIARRFMFNALLDSGCPVVAEWCGQFHTGNQLTGRSGTASPHQVGSEVRRWVKPIIGYLGFKPIKGRLV